MRELLVKIQIMVGERTTGKGGQLMLIGIVAMLCLSLIAANISSDFLIAGIGLAVAVVSIYFGEKISREKKHD